MAIHRGYVLVTDDRKAWLLLADRVRLWDTLDLIKTWADETGVSADVRQEMLQRVYDRGYQPSPRHPLYEWRDRLITRGEDSPPS